MGEPKYTIYVRVPIPRGDFVDPPQVDWDPEKDEALWRILSSATQKEIDWNDIAARFDVTVDFLLKQVAYLTERHASQVRAQVRKAAAAAKGSAAPSPIPAAESSTAADRRSHIGQLIGRDSPMPRNEANGAIRPAISRGGSGNTIPRDTAGSSPRLESKQPPSRPTVETANRRRISSLPIAAPSPKTAVSQDPKRDDVVSPGPADSTSGESSEDESSPAQSRIIRRPPRYQENDGSYQVDDDGDDESEPAFQPYKSTADQNSASDLASTLRDNRTSIKRGNKHPARERIHQSQTSDSSAGSGALGADSVKPRRLKSHTSNRNAAQSAQSPSGQGKLSSQEGSDGTPSMGSSFSDLDDASVTQSALEEALASNMHGAGSRFSISQAFRSRYFVNDKDEVRSIADPDYYFNHFLNKNQRVNLRQRTQFQAALRSIVHDRLESLGLRKTPLPPPELGSEAKHVNIFVSENIKSAERIIVVFGECAKELGMVASRIAGGPGGINKGTMVGAVKGIQRYESAGIILANMGESYWSQEYKRAVTPADSTAQSMPSLVHMGIKYDAQVNDIPGSETPLCHARTVLDAAVTQYANKEAKINIIALGDSCEVITSLLDGEKTWTRLGASLQGALFYSPAFYHEVKQEGLKNFFQKKARGYVVSEQPLGTPLSGTEGSTASRVPALGFPCYSSGEPCFGECCFVTALDDGLSYLDEVARTPNYENPVVMVFEPDELATAEEAERAWDALPADQKPSLSIADDAELREQLKSMRRLKYFEETGEAPDSSEEEEESDKEEETAGSELPVKPW
ncbi:Arb2 domain protein [Cordyceps fumosorosea ARSEF 2679]|uniref:Autophagy-related protein 29 n=1 Tax=Cordyceps fumosorosea (strain ARSEF 2679) TaxID=1081104 RepID=A0A162ME09_CORFA|nr:Arb2 domain protein [Cordyceps fumosorosea ARSEF 2679]OAA54900.1 Arb2 domain protein [Cordyceps fumosorosea ARSEF 2679]